MVLALTPSVRAAEIVGVDSSLDRIVAVDLNGGGQRVLARGTDLKAGSIHWAPDESFAYLVSGEGDRVVVYDPERGELSSSLEVHQPSSVTFSRSDNTAFVSGCELASIDTDTHAILDRVDVRPRSPWTIARGGRWLYGLDQRSILVFDLEHRTPAKSLEVLSAPLIEIESHPRAPDSAYVVTSRSVKVLDRDAFAEDEIFVNGVVLGMAIRADGQSAVVATDSGVAVIDLRNRQVTRVAAVIDPLGSEPVEVVAFDATTFVVAVADSLIARRIEDDAAFWVFGEYDDRDVTLSEDGVAALLSPAHRGLGFVQLLRYGRPVGESRIMRQVEDVTWRRSDASFYVLSDEGLWRIPSSDGEARLVVPNFGFSKLEQRPGQTQAFVLSARERTVRPLDMTTGMLGAAVFKSGESSPSDGVRDISLSPSGDRLFVAYGVDSLFDGRISVLDTGSGQVVGGYDWRLDDGTAGTGEVAADPRRIVALSDTDVFFIAQEVDIGVIDTGARRVVYSDRLISLDDWIVALEARADTDRVLVAGIYHPTDGNLPYLADVDPGSGEVGWWRGPAGQWWTSVAQTEAANLVYVGFDETHYDRSWIALVDLERTVEVDRVEVPGRVLELVAAPGGRWLIASLSADPSLIVLDREDLSIAGGYDAPQLRSLRWVGDGAAEELDWQVSVAVGSDAVPAGEVLAFIDEESGGSTLHVRSEQSEYSFDLAARWPRALAAGGNGSVVVGVTSDDNRSALLVVDARDGVVIGEVSLDGWPRRVVVTRAGDLAYVLLDTGDQSVLAIVDLQRLVVERNQALAARYSMLELSFDERHLYLASAGSIGTFSAADLADVDRNSVSEVSSIAAGAGGWVYYTTGDGPSIVRRYRPLDTQGQEVVYQVRQPTRSIRLLADRSGATIVVGAYQGCLNDLAWIDGGTGRIVADSAAPADLEIAAVSGDGRHAYIASYGRVARYDIAGGSDVWIPAYEWALGLAVGCVGTCEAALSHDLPDPTPTRAASATPTPRPTSTAIPTLPLDLASDQYWFEVRARPVKAGQTTEISIWYRGDYRSDSISAVQHELRLPSGFTFATWGDGVPDCEASWGLGSRDSGSGRIRARFEFLADTCAADGTCSAIRAIAASKWRLLLTQELYRCRVRVAPRVVPGFYEFAVADVVVSSWSLDVRPSFAESGVHVVGGAVSEGPVAHRTPPRLPRLDSGIRLTVAPIETHPGAEVWVETSLVASGGLALDGDFEATLDLGVVRLEQGDSGPACESTLERAGLARFELLPPGCVERGGCDQLHFRISLTTGEEDQPPAWLSEPSVPLFRCRGVVESGASGTNWIRVDGAYHWSGSHRADPMQVEHGRVDVVGTGVPAAPRARPELSTECSSDGLFSPLVCVEDRAAVAGGYSELVVRFRSSGREVAGIEMTVESSAIDWRTGSVPDCVVNPAINRRASGFRATGGNLKVLVVDLQDLSPLPDDVELFRCRTRVRADVGEGDSAVRLLDLGASDPFGKAMSMVGRSGILRVLLPGDSAVGSTDYREQTPRATATLRPVVTPAHTDRPILGLPIVAGAQEAASDGCTVVDSAGASRNWYLVLGLAALLFLRRLDRARGVRVRVVGHGLLRLE